MTASPMSGWWSFDHVGHVADADGSPSPRLADDHLGQLGRSRRSAGCGGSSSRWLGVSMKPPVPMIEPARCTGGCPASSASAVDLHHLVERDALAAISSGATCTTCISMRSPQIADVGHAGHTQQAGPDRPVRDHRLIDHRDVVRTRCRSSSPGWSTRAAAASPAARPTSAGSARRSCNRSWTSWRARDQVGAGLEDQLDRRELADRLRAQHVEAGKPGQRLLQRDGDQGLRSPPARVPAHASGSRPCGGANSGNTSTGMFRSCAMPKTIIAAAERDHEEAEPDARLDDPAHHRPASPPHVIPSSRRR